MEKLRKTLILLKEQQVINGNSILPVLIVNTTLMFEKRKEILSLKRLYVELPQFSDVSLKKHLRNLVSSHFLEILNSKIDLRSKTISSTEKLRLLEIKICDILND